MALSQTAAQSFVCDLCYKSSRRRDLLMRHRRRCRGPTRPGVRRKACEACVIAKAKCCYSLPICSRCVKRGTECQYLNTQKTSMDETNKIGNTSFEHVPQQTDTPDTLRPPEIDANLHAGAEPHDQLSFPETYVEFPFGSVDHLYTGTTPQPLANQETDTTQPLTLEALSDQVSSTLVHTALTPPDEDSLLALSSAIWDLPRSPLSNQCQSYTSPPVKLNATPYCLARTVCSYPLCLLKEMTSSLFLHQSLLVESDFDITSLPLTSMAICCGHMIKAKDASRFARKAMESEQQRLIEAFPSYKCMQQWDALHAMVLHETLELRESLLDDTEDWRCKPRRKGLRLPFLLKVSHDQNLHARAQVIADRSFDTFVKMIQCYTRSYPQLCNHDVNVFSEPSSTTDVKPQSAWDRWKTTETARRTVFLANMVNFLSNHDHKTRKQLAYYEPLDDEVVLNMPLPCSHAVWTASSEQEWTRAMQTYPAPTLSQILLPESSSSGHNSLSLPDSLQSAVAMFTKDALIARLEYPPGFESSESLRALIIHCGFEQYA